MKKRLQGNLLYAQSGGVTPVINATAGAVIETARRHPDRIGKVYAATNGILGALHEELVDTSQLSDKAVAALNHTPGGAFGSCRYKLKDFRTAPAEYERLIAVFAAHEIAYFLYNGGGDSTDTVDKIATFAAEAGYPLCCIGVPKTIDNDLPLTDVSPGFPTVAKYVAVATLEASLDVKSMASTSTKVFVLEVMGRHAGWIAAAAGLTRRRDGDPPHVILFPEIAFDEAGFLAKVKDSVERFNYCTIVVSEGVKDRDGRFLSEAGSRDAFGHAQLGGVGPHIASLIKDRLGYKYHWAVADYLQRSARHLASRVDVEQARAVGEAAVEYALAGQTAVMPVIKRLADEPYRWQVEPAPLRRIANREKKLPASYISRDGFGITPACRRYLAPLIAGEDYPPYTPDGLPDYVTVKGRKVKPLLPPWKG